MAGILGGSILKAFKYGLTNGPTEGFNNKINPTIDNDPILNYRLKDIAEYVP